MSELDFYSDGFDELSKLLEQYKIDDMEVVDVLEEGAKELVKDVAALPKPRSAIKTAGYTHLLDTVTYKTAKKEVEVGWGKYYGPMVERGAKTMNKAHPHVSTTFEQNKERYYQTMIKKLYG